MRTFPAKPKLNTEYRCKFCKVPVISKDNKRAMLGKEHGKKCPRRFK